MATAARYRACRLDQQSANGGDTVIHDPDTLNALLDSVERFVRERLVPAEHVVQETDKFPMTSSRR